MRVQVSPQTVEATGAAIEITVSVANTGTVISGYRVNVLGADPTWVSIDDDRPSLFPGDETVVTVVLTLPTALPAGRRAIAVQVTETTPPLRTVVEHVEVTVAENPATAVRLDPVTLTGGRSASGSVIVENQGNTTVRGRLLGSDPEGRLRFAFRPAEVDLAPGDTATVAAVVRGRRPVFGSPQVRQLGLRVRPVTEPDDATAPLWSGPEDPLATVSPTAEVPELDPPPADVAAPAASSRRRRRDRAVPEPDQVGAQPQALGSFVQRALISRAALSLVGLLAAITVFAVVITAALSGVVDRSAADRDLAIAVAQASDADGTNGQASVVGTVTLITSGEPVAGVAVEAFAASDPATPLTQTASDDEGRYVLDGLTAGSYLLRFRGAGYADVWSGSASAADEATPVEVASTGSTDGIDVTVGGLPATVEGTVDGIGEGEELTGAVVEIRAPLDQLGAVGAAAEDPGPEAGGSEPAEASGALVQRVPVGSDGSFSFVDIPSPAVYDLVVTGPGLAGQAQRLDLAGGEQRSGVTVAVQEGDGLITGEVAGVDGPIGGVSVVATFGESTARTVSLTEGDVGAFTLRGLPTPGTFTVVFAAPGYASQTLTLDLAEGQELTGVAVTLGTDAGALTGTVTTADGEGAADVTVTVSDGTEERETVTQSTGTVGSWQVGDLPVPGTYTVTFGREDLASQTVQAQLDAFGVLIAGGSAEDGVTVQMRAAGADLTGTVALRDAITGEVSPAGNVEVVAVSGSDRYLVTSASAPAAGRGGYVLPSLPAGTYTVTADRPGSTPVSETIVLESGDAARLDLSLPAPASMRVRVGGPDGPVSGALVALHTATTYGTGAGPVAELTTDADGQVTFVDIEAPENYVVDVRLQRGGAPVAASDPVTVEASDSLELELEATETGGNRP